MNGSSKQKRTAYKDPLVQLYAFRLGKSLRDLRKKQGLTQERLALMIGTKHSRISNIERGCAMPSFPDVVKLCRALEVDPKDLADVSTLKCSEHPLPSDDHAPV